MAFKLTSFLATGDISVSINVSSPRSTIAPASFKFTASFAENVSREPATGAYASYTDLDFLLAEYYWIFSDSETGVFTGIQNFASQRNALKEFGTGRSAMKCFETAGTHSVSVLVIFPDGRTGFAQTSVQVGDPQVEYTAAETIVWSPNGDFTGAPTHDGANECQTWAQVKARYANIGTSRVYVRLDETQTAQIPSSGSSLATSDNPSVTELVFGTWTRGSKATWDFFEGVSSVFALTNQSAVIKFEDIHFKGYYNPTTELGAEIGKLLQDDSDSEIIFNRCSDEGGGIGIQSGNSTTGWRVHWNNHYRKNWGDFMMLWPRASGDVALTGCGVIQKSDAAAGGRSKQIATGDILRNEHNGCRIGASFVYITGSQFYCRSGWSGFGGLTENPIFRLGRNNPVGMYVVFAGNVIESQGVMTLDDNVGLIEPRHAVFERNYFIISPLGMQAWNCMSGLCTFRNNIFLKHDTPNDRPGYNWRACVGFGPYQINTETLDEPVFGINNTIVDLSSDGNLPQGTHLFVNLAGNMNHLEEHQTYIDRPNTTPPLGGDLDNTPLAWNSLWTHGSFHNWASLANTDPVPLTNFTSGSDVGPGQSFDIPYADNIKTFDVEVAGGVQLGQADFSDADRSPERHQFRFGPDGSMSGTTEFSLSFGATAITVTNTSVGVTWLSTDLIQLMIDTGLNPTPTMDEFIHPSGTVSLYRPTAAVAGDGDLLTAFDFEALPRVGSHHPDAAAGTYTAGAIDPAA